MEKNRKIQNKWAFTYKPCKPVRILICSPADEYSYIGCRMPAPIRQCGIIFLLHEQISFIFSWPQEHSSIHWVSHWLTHSLQQNHLYGDANNLGLISQLSKRVGMVKMLSKYMNKTRLKEFICGMFYSKLSYCLPVFGNVFGMEKYKEQNRRYMSFTVKDNNRLQILQNKVNRLLLDADPLTPTADLLQLTNSLSIHQIGLGGVEILQTKWRRLRKLRQHFMTVESLFGSPSWLSSYEDESHCEQIPCRR